MSNLSFGAVVYENRLRLGMSQAAAARIAGLSTGYFSELENEKRSAPPLATARRIAKSLQLKPEAEAALAALADAERSARNTEALPAPARALITVIRRCAPQLTADAVVKLTAVIEEACM